MNKKDKWYACMMDSGIIAKADSLKELLGKLNRKSAKYIYRGFYEIKERNNIRGWSVWLCYGEEMVKKHGWSLDAEENTWDYD